jgi:hypothetical protein
VVDIAAAIGSAQPLLAAVATSAAALVAISGGLLVSRIVALLSEREALQRRREQIGSERRIKRERIDTLEEARRQDRSDTWDGNHLREVVAVDGDFDQLKEILLCDLDSDVELAGFAQRRCAQAREALNAIRAVFSTFEPPPCDIEGLKAGGVLVPDDAANVYFEAAQKIARERRTPLQAMFATPEAPRFHIPDLSSIAGQRAQEITKLTSDVTLLSAEDAVLVRAISALRPARDVWAPLGALLFFAATGVVFPIVRLAMWPNNGSAAVRLATVVLFLIGLSALLGSIVFATLRLNRQPLSPAASEGSTRASEVV